MQPKTSSSRLAEEPGKSEKRLESNGFLSEY